MNHFSPKSSPLSITSSSNSSYGVPDLAFTIKIKLKTISKRGMLNPRTKPKLVSDSGSGSGSVSPSFGSTGSTGLTGSTGAVTI